MLIITLILSKFSKLLRIQALYYGRKSKNVEFNKERIGEIINKVQKLISDIEKELN
ncbi:Uncharacterised protein [uncultured archaeon]|nr:Uncharacterised protein [uncultured archaeon]